jgi:hypothetical protein
VRTTADEQSAASAVGVDGLLTRAAHHIAATRDFTEQEIHGAAELMAKMSGAEPERSTLRRNRKLVTRLLSRRGEGEPSPTAQMWGNR